MVYICDTSIFETVSFLVYFWVTVMPVVFSVCCDCHVAILLQLCVLYNNVFLRLLAQSKM